MIIKEIAIAELYEYENNPRHNEKAIDAVAESIKEFGWKVPIVVDKDNVIVAGHTRYRAAQKLGYDTVPCLVADDLTPNQIKAYRLADNKTAELAEWDFTKLEEELAEIDMNMEAFGFEIDEEDIEWAGVTNLSDDTYEEPEHDRLRCPVCGAVDYKMHFVKV